MTLEYDIDGPWPIMMDQPVQLHHNCQLIQIDQLYLLNAIMCYANQQLCCYPCQHDNSVTIMAGKWVCREVSKTHILQNLSQREK